MKKILLLMLTISIIVLFSLSSVIAANVDEVASKYDLGGETVTIMLYGRFDPYKPENWDDGQEAAWKESVEEMFNCNIEFATLHYAEQGDYLKEQVLAGDKPGDIIHWQFPWVVDWKAFDFLLPLNDVVEDEYWDRLPNVGITDPEKLSIAGKQYMIPEPGVIAPGIYWNKDLFEREGLPDLYELAENREWTWDKMIEIANEATKDTDGDGVIDQWGISASTWYFDKFVGHGMLWAYLNDALPMEYRDGQMVFTADEPKFIEALEFFADEANSAPSDNSPEDHQIAFQNGKGAMTHHPGDLDNMEDDWGFVPYPMGPSADEYQPSIATAPQGFLVPVTVDNARAKIEVATALFEMAEPYIDKENYLEEVKEEMALNVRDRETIKWRLWISENIQVDVSNKGGLPESVIETIRDAAAGEVSGAAAMDSVKQEAQAYLDDLFN